MPWCATSTDAGGHYDGGWATCPVCSGGCRDVDDNACVLPFVYQGVRYDSCTADDNDGVPWCATGVEEGGVYVSGSGKWGNCGENCD